MSIVLIARILVGVAGIVHRVGIDLALEPGLHGEVRVPAAILSLVGVNFDGIQADFLCAIHNLRVNPDSVETDAFHTGTGVAGVHADGCRVIEEVAIFRSNNRYGFLLHVELLNHRGGAVNGELRAGKRQGVAFVVLGINLESTLHDFRSFSVNREGDYRLYDLFTRGRCHASRGIRGCPFREISDCLAEGGLASRLVGNIDGIRVDAGAIIRQRYGKGNIIL